MEVSVAVPSGRHETRHCLRDTRTRPHARAPGWCRLDAARLSEVAPTATDPSARCSSRSVRFPDRVWWSNRPEPRAFSCAAGHGYVAACAPIMPASVSGVPRSWSTRGRATCSEEPSSLTRVVYLASRRDGDEVWTEIFSSCRL
eukprot:scaffold42594_cov64-Phaeocystis_antarctica.AAC.3